MTLDDHFGWSGSKAITAREYFRTMAQALLDTPRGQRNPELYEKWLQELVMFLDCQPTTSLPKELDL